MKKLANAAMLIVTMMVGSKVLGIIREMLLAKQFGTSYIVDVYTVCSSLSSVLFVIFASGFAESYIPIYARIRTQKEKNLFFSNLTNILVIIAIVICVACIIFSEGVLKLLAPGFEGEVARLANSFIKIISLHLPFFVVFNICTAQLRAEEDFAICYFCDYIVINMIIILSILFASPQQCAVLAYGYVASIIVALLILFAYLLKKKEIKYYAYLSLKDDNIKQISLLAIPIGLSLFANKLNHVIDRMFASSLGEGVVSALSYAEKVQLIPYSLVVSVFMTVCIPRINKYMAENADIKAMHYVKKAYMISIYISIPTVMFLILYSEQIVSVLFERGMFIRESTLMTANCLKLYALGIPFYAFREISTNVLTAKMKKKAIFRNTIIVCLTNIIFNFILIRSLGYIALPVATSISGAVASVLMNNDMKKEGLFIFSKDQWKEYAKVLMATIVAVLVCQGIYTGGLNIFCTEIAFIIGGIVAIIVYIAVTVKLDVEIVYWIYKMLPTRFQIIKKWN